MRIEVEKASRHPAGPMLAIAGLGLLSLLLNDDPALQRSRASLINVLPAASAHAVSRQYATASSTKLKKLGERRAIVFSPDFAASGNRPFYEGLGFKYWETANWRVVLREIKQFNSANPGEALREIFFETHGSNGHGLKLQQSELRSAPRSYISLGALQEHLGEAGVESAILTACNTGRLYRPEIYKKLNLSVKDPTVLPATLGVINASPKFNPSSSQVKLIRRTDSRIEQTSEGHYYELPASVRRALELAPSSKTFTVSNMFIQMIVKDDRLELTSSGFVRKISDSTESELVNESIFQSFLKFLDDLAADQTSSTRDRYYLESHGK
ncbi:MAG: hypothetical protein MOB07_16835 [Acidobacteria bacterium]|nr:hypothetical protein [Acidobacteriota bacterium]